MPRFVAFLRGINVGGNKHVPMARLRTLFEALGYDDVKTLLQSGNVVFSATFSSNVKKKLEDAFTKEFGFSSATFLKKHTGPELIKSNGSELYIYYPEGVGRSKLRIPFNGTARNWNTALKVKELMASAK